MSRLDPFTAVIGIAVVAFSVSLDAMASNPFQSGGLQASYQLADASGSSTTACNEPDCDADEDETNKNDTWNETGSTDQNGSTGQTGSTSQTGSTDQSGSTDTNDSADQGSMKGGDGKSSINN